MSSEKKLPPSSPSDVTLEIIEESLEQEEFPPGTASLLSWSALRFIRAPSSLFLAFSVLIVAIGVVFSLIAARFIEIDVAVRSAGELVSDFGSREALAPSS